MTEMQGAPPMGGANLPPKEMEKEEIKPEVKKASPQQKKRQRLLFLAGLLIALFFALGIGLGFYFSQNTKPVVEPLPSASPSPSPEIVATPTPSPAATGFQGRLESFEQKLDETDLKEEKLIPPVLDFDIRFKSKDE